MRNRERVLGSLESVYREAFEAAKSQEDPDAMARLDFEFQRDQLQLEVLLDIRDLIATPAEDPEESSSVGSLLERAQALRNLTKLR